MGNDVYNVIGWLSLSIQSCHVIVNAIINYHCQCLCHCHCLCHVIPCSVIFSLAPCLIAKQCHLTSHLIYPHLFFSWLVSPRAHRIVSKLKPSYTSYTIVSRALTFSQCRTAELLQSARSASETQLIHILGAENTYTWRQWYPYDFNAPETHLFTQKEAVKDFKEHYNANEGPGQRSADIGSCSAICKDELEMLEDNM